MTINENVSRELANVSTAANQGGYNLVRFAFDRSGTFYRFKLSSYQIQDSRFEEGDYIELSSGHSIDIPAYGFYRKAVTSGDWIDLKFKGDFTQKYTELIMTNVTKGIKSVAPTYQERQITRKPADFTEEPDNNPAPIIPDEDDTEQDIVPTEVILDVFEAFAGTSLMDYNPNDNKRQLFNVIDDQMYGGRTQYVSFDLNRDGNYNFVYIGSVANGKDGASIYSTDGTNFDYLVTIMKQYDAVLVSVDNPNIGLLPNAALGDIWEYQTSSSFIRRGNIRGAAGAQGIKGDTGATGATGPQGPAGAIGATGPQGPQGEPGQGLRIHDGIKATPAELPAFSATQVADAYVVLNTTGAVATYDLYYHAIDGTTWSILPNWGGVPGPAGPQGATGATGPAGPAGPAGVATPGDITALVEGSDYISVDMNEAGNKVRVGLDMTMVDEYPQQDSEKLVKSGGVMQELTAKLNANKTAVATVGGLVKPTATPATTELVGVNEKLEQVRVNIGSGLAYNATTKTLSASGGGGGGDRIYMHSIRTNQLNFLLFSTDAFSYEDDTLYDLLTGRDYKILSVIFEDEGNFSNCLFCVNTSLTTLILSYIDTEGATTHIEGLDSNTLITTDIVTPKG